MRKGKSIAIMNALREVSDSSRMSRLPVGPLISSKKRHDEVIGEDLFQRFLCWERKRAERSSRCFVLMLLDIEKVLRDDQTGEALTKILSAISQSTRETDLVGWYYKGAVLGVIYTELGEQGGEAFSRFTRAKVTGALEGRLLPEESRVIHISFHTFPNHWNKSSMDQLADKRLYPDLFNENKGTRFFRLLKRVMDIVGSTVALILFCPLYVVIAIAIKLTSKGPVLFRQERIGQYGQRFTFLKFRTMHCGNDPSLHRDYVKRFIAGQMQPSRIGDEQTAVYKILDDPRVTRVGKFLRKTSMDELPQFINVWRGDMSLVGPRPPIPYELEAYQTWHRRRVLEIKPGITGLWQVHGRSRTTFDEMVRLDLQYVKAWSPWLDIKILLQTPLAVFSGQGAC